MTGYPEGALMASRSSRLVFSAVLALIPGVVLAQADSSAPPPEVDKALRANVTEFFQDFIDKKFRQALNFVADDTQDKYFSSPKAEITEFKVSGIEYAENFTEATVKVDVKIILHLKAEGFLQDSNVPEHWDTHWKIENGKWVYYEKPVVGPQWLTPMGPSAPVDPNAKVTEPPKLISEEALAKEAQRILSGTGTITGVTPKEVKFTQGKPGSAKLTFNNGLPGQVQISVEGISEQIPCLASKVDHATVNAGEQSTVEIIYDPTSGPTPTAPITLGVVVAPFSQIFPVSVTFDAPAH